VSLVRPQSGVPVVLNAMPKEYINPDSLFQSLEYGFSQIVAARGSKTIYISGQTAWDAQRQTIGGTDLAQQTRQALRNVQAAIEAVGGRLADIVALRIYVNYKPEQAGAERFESSFPKSSVPQVRGLEYPR
jgi:enamine deaminase RidA (YjgF/YER057c/UK114 family)